LEKKARFDIINIGSFIGLCLRTGKAGALILENDSLVALGN
jgi:hypothetical protein